MNIENSFCLVLNAFSSKFYGFQSFPSLYIAFFPAFLITHFPKCVFNLYERRDAFGLKAFNIAIQTAALFGFRLTMEKNTTNLKAFVFVGIYIP